MKHSLKAVLAGLIFCLGMVAVLPASAQESFTLSGTVYEKASGLPAPGAAVMVKGTGTGVTTDLDGKYSIPSTIAPHGSNGMLTVSAIALAVRLRLRTRLTPG